MLFSFKSLDLHIYDKYSSSVRTFEFEIKRLAFESREIEKFMIRQPPKGEKDEVKHQKVLGRPEILFQ